MNLDSFNTKYKVCFKIFFSICTKNSWDLNPANADESKYNGGRSFSRLKMYTCQANIVFTAVFSPVFCSRNLFFILACFVILTWTDILILEELKASIIISLMFWSRVSILLDYFNNQKIITIYTPVRSLRSVNKWLLVVPKYNLKSYGMRAFSVMAPLLWNNLPEDIRTINLLNIFKN